MPYVTDVPKRRDFKPKLGYPSAVTVCIAAICTEGDRELIILCSDRKISYGVGAGSANIGFKLRLAGCGWAAQIAGPTSDAERLVSFYRNHLDSTVLNEGNFRAELARPLTSYKQWIANQYVRNNYFTEMEELLREKRSTGLGRDRDRILNEVQAIRFEETVLLSGYVESLGYLFTASCEGVTEHRYFACIGSGGWLAQAALLHRGFTSDIQIEEALYLVYEAKKFSEKDDHVGETTMLLVQESSGNPLEPALIIRTVSPDGISHLEEQYRMFGLQPYRPTPYKQPNRFYV